MANLKNKLNGYAFAAGADVFDKCPKSVFAAIAVSGVTCGGDLIDEARERIIREWWVLFQNGIVPQKPPFPNPKDATDVPGEKGNFSL